MLVPQLRLKKKQRGQTLTLSFTIVSKYTGRGVESDEINVNDLGVESDEINVNDLAWVRFRFAIFEFCTGDWIPTFSILDFPFELKSTMIFKRHENAKSANVIINLSCDEFKKECICRRDERIDEMKIDPNPKQCDFYNISKVIVFNLEVTVIARNVTRPSTIINKILEDTDFTDFQLCASDGGVAIHKLILSLHSDMFKTMLRGEWKETAEGRINMAGVTVQTLQHLKEYMYLGTLPDDGLEPLLLLAARYLMDTLKADCIQKLVRRVEPENVHGLIKLACENNFPDLIKAILLETPEATINGIYNLKHSKEEQKPSNIN